MPRPFVVAYDASPAAREALDLAVERARALKARVVVVTVVPTPLQYASFTRMLLPTLDLPTQMRESESYVENARKSLEAVADEVRRSGVEAEARVRVGDPADEIIAAAEEADADQVWMGYKSFEKRIPHGLGSTVDKVVRYSDRTVTVVRPRKR